MDSSDDKDKKKNGDKKSDTETKTATSNQTGEISFIKKKDQKWLL